MREEGRFRSEGLGQTPMLCIGESLTEREAGRTAEVLTRQLKSGNADTLAKIPNVNGFLVGGASLEPQSFRAIIVAAQSGG